MKSVVAWAIVLGGALVAACGGGSSPPLGKTCLMNSECANPLSCTFGKCHAACAEARDCPTGQLCVKSPTGNVCQQSEESVCQYRSQCSMPLICAIDRKCRSQCLTDIDCPTKTQKCVQPDHVCAEPDELDPGLKIKAGAGKDPVPEIPDGGIPGADGATGGGGTGGSVDANMMGTGGGGGGNGGTGGGPACISPQTTFGNVAKGDGNPNFTSGAGVRVGDKFLIFSGYEGPPAGASADAGASGSAVHVQAFDVNTGKSQGPAASLFAVPDAPYFYVQGAAVAPGGEVVVLHSNGTSGNGAQTQLYATFLAPAGGTDAGAAGLGVVRTVQLEAVLFDTPRIIWSPASSNFIASWQYRTNIWQVRVRRFLADGRGGGGDTMFVPAPPLDNRWGQGNVGVSGKFLGVATVDNSNYYPHLAVLDAEGNGVGSNILLHNTGLGSAPYWVTVGGTTAGFVTISHQGTSAYLVFVPINAMGLPTDPTDAGVPDGGATPYPVVTFTSNATAGHMVSDDVGGTGAVLLEPNGASFLYVKADGTSRVATGTVISSSDGVQTNISTYRSSFVVSLYEKTSHATKVVASGCSP
jgi:hypothetical protein